MEALFRTIPAESALEGTDHGVARIGRQILVAAFAVWTQFQHSLSRTAPQRFFGM